MSTYNVKHNNTFILSKKCSLIISKLAATITFEIVSNYNFKHSYGCELKKRCPNTLSNYLQVWFTTTLSNWLQI